MKTSPVLELDPSIGVRVDEDAAPSAQKGVHVLVGENNSGKSRALQAIAGSSYRWSFRVFEQFPDLMVSFPRWTEFTAAVAWARPAQGGLGRLEIPSQPEPLRDEHTRRVLKEQVSRAINEGLVGAPRGARHVPHHRQVAASAHVGNVGLGFSGDLTAFPAELATLAQNEDGPGAAAHQRIRDAFTELTEGARLRFSTPGSGRRVIQVRERSSGGDWRTLDACGDGLRDLLFIITAVESWSSEDLMMDEPGLRLHPRAQRKLLGYLHRNATDRAIWIATHDPTFVGSELVRTRSVVSRVDGESRVRRLADREEARGQLGDLGWLPADAFLAERVLYVEGPSDLAILGLAVDHVTADFPELGGTVVWPLGTFDRVKETDFVRSVQLMRRVAPYARHVALLDRPNSTNRPRARDIEKLGELGLELRYLDRSELEDYLLAPPVVRTMLEAFRVAKDVELELPEDIEIPEGPKGSARLDAVWQKVFQTRYDKAMGAEAALAALPSLGEQDWRALKNEVKAVLAAVASER